MKKVWIEITEWFEVFITGEASVKMGSTSLLFTVALLINSHDKCGFKCYVMILIYFVGLNSQSQKESIVKELTLSITYLIFVECNEILCAALSLGLT